MENIRTFLFVTFLVFSFGCVGNDIEEYIKDLNSENIIVRDNAVYQIGKCRERQAIPILLKLLADGQPKKSKLLIIEALGKIGDSRSVDILINYLGEKDNEIRAASIEALGMTKDPKAVKYLLQILNDKDARITAIWALGNIGDRSAIPGLINMLNDQDKYVRFNASQSLKKIGITE